MRAVDVIMKKRDGLELSSEEIQFFISGFNDGSIPDYQAAAWAMAVLLQGMSARETADLTQAMAASGERIDLSGTVECAVDKHSTGGVGDKTTLVVEPLVAACGVSVGKMSGRGLGFTGGTLDKMESIPGFRVQLSTEEFLDQLKNVGLVLAGQTAKLAPADGKMYALRDVTGTVPSVPLIASSVMSKKIASGAHGVVLDVKVGLGAFMQTLDEAEELAELMVEIGKHADRRVVALISDMNQPLGNAIGNALELIEAVETLRGGGPADFNAHCLEVAGQMLLIAGRFPDLEGSKKAAADALSSGSAMEAFERLVQAQGGDIRVLDDFSRLPAAKYVATESATKKGHISELNAREVGLAAMELGAGRAKKGDLVDHAVGIVVHKKIGDEVTKGEPLYTVYANDERLAERIKGRINEAYSYSEKPVDPLPHFYRAIDSLGSE